LQRIALVQVKVGVGAELVLQDGDQVQVQLDHIQACAAVQQTFGERALTRADFHQALAVARVDGAQDAVDDAGVVQEILAEALARAVLILGHKDSSRLQAASKAGAESRKFEGAQFTSATVEKPIKAPIRAAGSWIRSAVSARAGVGSAGAGR